MKADLPRNFLFPRLTLIWKIQKKAVETLISHFLFSLVLYITHHSPEQENLGQKYNLRLYTEPMFYAPTLVEMGNPRTLRVGHTGRYTRSLLSAL